MKWSILVSCFLLCSCSVFDNEQFNNKGQSERPPVGAYCMCVSDSEMTNTKYCEEVLSKVDTDDEIMEYSRICVAWENGKRYRQ